MELKKIILTIFFLGFINSANAEMIKPAENLSAYGVKVLSDEKQQFFYEWHVSKGNEENCVNCWFTTAVSMPLDQGNSI